MIERTIEGQQCSVIDTSQPNAITLCDIFYFAFKNNVTVEVRKLQETGFYTLVRLRKDGYSSEACILCSDIDDDPAAISDFNNEAARDLNLLLERLIHEINSQKET